MFANHTSKRRLPLLLIAMVLVLATLVGCAPTGVQKETNAPTDGPTTTAPVGTDDPDPSGSDVPSIYVPGDKVADFTVTMSDGKEMTLSKLLESKELVILNFWATWCGPCQMEFPYMEEAYLKYQDKMEIIALSVDPEDTNDAIETFKKDNGLTALPMGQDSIELNSNFYFDGIPTTIAIDRFGVICWQETGSITSADKFERLFSGFLGEDYTESKVDYVIPGPKPTVANAEPEALAAALNAEGGKLAVANSQDANDWPFLPTEDGALKSTNAGMDETQAVVMATVSAKAGEVLAFDYTLSSEVAMDFLILEVDGETIEVFSGQETGTYAYAFPADGDHAVRFIYRKDMMEGAGEDHAIIDDMCLLSGDAAAAALAAMPTYPLTLEGTACEIIPLDAKQAVVTDPKGQYETLMESTPTYLVTGNEATFLVKLGKELNPKTAVVYTYTTEDTYAVNTLTQTDEGFTVTLPLSSVETDGYSSTMVFVQPNIVENPDDFVLIYVFASEENMNYFVTQELPYYGVEDASWTYSDGSAPSTDALPQPPEDVGLPDGMAQYGVQFVDQNGDPVANVMAQICDAETCEVLPSDENGIVVCVKPMYAYEIHVLSAPEGYTFDTQKIYVMPAEGGELVIKGTKN